MPDTFENQEQYPQNPAQKIGLRFPIIRLTAIISLSSGAVLNIAMDDYYSSEHGLLRSMPIEKLILEKVSVWAITTISWLGKKAKGQLGWIKKSMINYLLLFTCVKLKKEKIKVSKNCDERLSSHSMPI